MADDVLFDLLHMEIVRQMSTSTNSDDQVCIAILVPYRTVPCPLLHLCHGYMSILKIDLYVCPSIVCEGISLFYRTDAWSSMYIILR